MSLSTIKVKIKGLPPGILMHRFPMEPIEAIEKKTKEEQAEIAAYRCPETGQLYIPGVAVQRALINGAGFSKGKGRASLSKQTAACLMISPERILTGQKDYEIDSRPIVNPTTKGRIIRHRPRLNNWEIQFDLEYDDTLLSEQQIRRIVDDTGSRVGLLEFRPEKKGPFGRFVVVNWDDK